MSEKVQAAKLFFFSCKASIAQRLSIQALGEAVIPFLTDVYFVGSIFAAGLSDQSIGRRTAGSRIVC